MFVCGLLDLGFDRLGGATNERDGLGAHLPVVHGVVHLEVLVRLTLLVDHEPADHDSTVTQGAASKVIPKKVSK